MKPRATIKDIAKELKISPSTVSRALADNPIVKQTTREAVKQLAKELSYTPNITALNLRSRKTNTIGIIIPHIVHEYFASIIRGVEEFAYSNGYGVLISCSHDRYEREKIDANSLLQGNVDGLLACVSSETKNVEHFRAFQNQGIPLVFFDCVVGELKTPKVVVDDLDAGYLATKHLISKGCRSIAYIGGPDTLTTNMQRFAGYQNALATHNLDSNPSLAVHCRSGDHQDGYAECRKLLEGNRFDGLFTGTDMLGIGAIKAAKEYGLRIPHDLAIIGFSDWSISSLFEPSLSTIRQPGQELGEKATELLIEQINNPENNNYETNVLKTELIERESSKRP